MKERRRWPRLALAVPVFVRGLDREGHELLDLGTTLNISAGGVLFAVHKHLQHGARISLEIPAAFPSSTLREQVRRKFRARIVRAGRRNHFFRYAARFCSFKRVAA